MICAAGRERQRSSFSAGTVCDFTRSSDLRMTYDRSVEQTHRAIMSALKAFFTVVVFLDLILSMQIALLKIHYHSINQNSSKLPKYHSYLEATVRVRFIIIQ